MRLIAILVALAVYAACSLLWGGDNPALFWQPANMRYLLPVAFALGWFLVKYRPPPPPPPPLPPKRNRLVTETELAAAEAESEAAIAAESERELSAVEASDAAVIAEAERFWRESQRLAHGETPDPIDDAAYLFLVHSAAEGGSVPALAALSEYAFASGHLVEAYFWMALAEERSEPGEFRVQLNSLVDIWLENGCPEERDNVYGYFSEMRGDYARALLRIQTGVAVSDSMAEVQTLHEQIWNQLPVEELSGGDEFCYNDETEIPSENSMIKE